MQDARQERVHSIGRSKSKPLNHLTRMRGLRLQVAAVGTPPRLCATGNAWGPLGLFIGLRVRGRSRTRLGPLLPVVSVLDRSEFHRSAPHLARSVQSRYGNRGRGPRDPVGWVP